MNHLFGSGCAPWANCREHQAVYGCERTPSDHGWFTPARSGRAHGAGGWCETSFRHRVLFSQDRDLLREAAERQRRDVPFAGVIYAHQLEATVGQCVKDLELLAYASDPGDFANRMEYLPLL